LELEGVGRIETQIDKKKGIFVERKAIKRFFQVNELKPGDEIEAEKINSNHFQIKLIHVRDNAMNVNKADMTNKNESKNCFKEQLALFEPVRNIQPNEKRKSNQIQKRANDLDGKEWTSNSISVWRDIRKTSDEMRLDHPAMFPTMQRRILVV